MASKTKKWTGGALSKSQVWAFSPPVTANAPSWTLTVGNPAAGKSLTVVSNGTQSDAVNQMLAAIQASQEPEWLEITASVPSSINPADNPQGGGTNEIQAVYITGTPTDGSFQLGWGGSNTSFLPDPLAPVSVSDSGSAGNLTGNYRWTVTFLNVNPLGQIGETLPSPEMSATLSLSGHSANVALPLGINNPAANQVCIGRRIYRTAAGGAAGTESLVATVWDNSTTTFNDNLADGSLGAAQPTANTTGIAYNATASQVQDILQTFSSILPGNVNVWGNGTTAAPWLIQFCNALGALKQTPITAGGQSFTFAATVPAGIQPKVSASEIQQGVLSNASPPADGNTLLLVSRTSGVPFYVTSQVAGVIPPKLHVNQVQQTIPPAQGEINLTESPAGIQVARIQQARQGSNELQEITISPDALAGSTFTLSWGGGTTNAIPIPPVMGSVTTSGTGVLTGSYYYSVTWLTSTGETEPSAPFAAPTASSNQYSVPEPANAPSVVTKFRVYRTKAGGAITGPYYLVTTQNKGSGAYTDNNADSAIAGNAPPPTTNGVLEGELEGLSAIGIGNVQVRGANFAAYSGMTINDGFPCYPPVISTAAITTKPGTPTLVASGSGGALATGTYFYQVTAIDSQGETLPGAESSVSVAGPNGRVIISWSAVTGATGYRIYRGTSTQKESTLLAVVTALSFTDYGASPSPIVYKIQFINALGNSPQPIIQGNPGNISLLPTITISENQAGFPVGNEVQALGWVQKYGNATPSGTFTITLPGLNVTTAAIGFGASAGTILSAIQAAVPLANFNDYAVTDVIGAGSYSARIVAISYQGTQALTEVPLAIVDTSGMTPAAGDSVSPYMRVAQQGSPVGRNEIATITLNSALGGTFGLTATLANGNTFSATGIAYNASAATVQAAFPAATMQVTGSAGGPYKIESVGEAGTQKVVWSATDSLTALGVPSGVPPTTNTATISPPVVTVTTGTSGGALASGTYYYKVTAVNANGETTSPEWPATVTGPTGYVELSWSAVTTATSYNIYRGIVPGDENVLVANVTSTSYYDYGGTNLSQSPPTVNTAVVTPPGLNYVNAIGGGALSAAAHYYKVTAIINGLETVGSNEVSVTTLAGQAVNVFWSAISGATSYNIYRGTAAGSENLLVGSTTGTVSGSYLLFTDSGPINTAASPPGSNTATISAPSSLAASDPVGEWGSVFGIQPSATYYYKVTAANGAGETTTSNEASFVQTDSTRASCYLSWSQVQGATSYKIYRGTSSGSENLLIATTTNTVFIDTDLLPVSASPPGSGGTAPTAPTLNVYANDTTANISALAAGTYYYKITYSTSGGETLPSTEASITITVGQLIQINIPSQAVGGTFTGWNIYRGTSSGGENVRIMTNNNILTIGSNPNGGAWIDMGETNTSASPPGSNTATIAGPAITATASTNNGELATGTYYYKATSVNSNGESTPSTEQSASVTGPTGSVSIAITPVAGATTYNLYRGTSTGSENVLIASVPGSNSSYIDAGGTDTSQSPPVSNATLIVPTIINLTAGPSSGAFTVGYYYWEITAFTPNGETTPSNERFAFVNATNTTTINWSTIPGASGYKVYRGTSSGGENVLVATVNSSTTTSFTDVGPSNTVEFPPSRNTALIAAPVQAPATPSSGAGSMSAGTYYYVITALADGGETIASNEESATISGGNNEVLLSWYVVPGATGGYNIYRGTASGKENILVGTVGYGGSTYTDTASGGSGLGFKITELFAGLTPLNDKQTITLTNVGGGTWGVSFDNQSVTNLAFNVSASSLQTQLQLLPNIGLNNCAVTLTASAGTEVYTVEFAGALATLQQPLLQALGITTQTPPTINNAEYLYNTGQITGTDTFGNPEYLFLTGPMLPPNNLAASTLSGGILDPNPFPTDIYYVVTALGAGTNAPTGETTPSVEAVAGVSGTQGTVELTWAPPIPPSNLPDVLLPTGYNIYRGFAPGKENQLIATVPGTVTKFIDDGSAVVKSTLQGGGQYLLKQTGTDNFTISFGGQTTVAIAYNASNATIQGDIQGLSTIGGGNAIVSGTQGDWTITLTPNVAGTGTLSAQAASVVEFASYSSVFGVDVQLAIAGTFTLTYASETTAGIAFNATAAQIQTALSALPVISASSGLLAVSVTGPAGGPWGITITTTAQTASYTMSGDPTSLIGASGVFQSYPVTYCYAIGPNFYDAPSNWADGIPPSLYIAPPVIQTVVPVATDATLLPIDKNGNATHGSLTSGTTYYYKVTATNANGETVGSNEGSAEAFAGAYIYVNDTPTAGSFTLTYGGATATIPYNYTSSQIQTALQGLSSLGSGKCTVTGAGTANNPFIFQLSGTLAGTSPTPLVANSSGLTGGTVSIRNLDTRSLAVMWSEVYGATGYKVYRGTSASGENVLVATLASPDQTVFVDDGTYTTTSASPPTNVNSYNTAVGDDVYFTGSSVSCSYNIAADITNGYSIHGGYNGLNYGQVNSLTSDASYTGRPGLSAINPAGYVEYRPRALTIMGPPAGIFNIAIGNGSGAGSSLIVLDTGTCQVAGVVNHTATPTNNDPAALLWIGNNSSSEWDLFFGTMAIAVYPGQTFTLGTLRQAYQTNPNTDTTLEIGAGGTITTYYMSGGVSLIHCNVTTLKGKGGTIMQDLGTPGTLTLDNCDYISKSTSEITSVTVGSGGTFDRTQDSRPVKVDSATVYAGGTYNDPHGATYSGSVGVMTVSVVQCGLQPGDSNGAWVDLGRNITLQRTDN